MCLPLLFFKTWVSPFIFCEHKNGAYVLFLNHLARELEVLWIKYSCLVLSLWQGKKLHPMLCVGCRLTNCSFHGSSDPCSFVSGFKYLACLLAIQFQWYWDSFWINIVLPIYRIPFDYFLCYSLVTGTRQQYSSLPNLFFFFRDFSPQ